MLLRSLPTKEPLPIDHSSLEIDNLKAEREISSFITRIVKASRAAGVVVGLSGGVDSSVVAALCGRSLGNDKVLGVLMFEAKDKGGPDYRDAVRVSEHLGIDAREVSIDKPLTSFLKGVTDSTEDRVVLGNLKARIRMTSLYYYGNLLNNLVAGTGDRSEDLIGYFTKYGDGGVDFLPIAHLYKTQVRQLASYLGLPKDVISKPASPNLWEGHKATDEIPVDYDMLDLVLYSLFEQRLDIPQVSNETGVEESLVREILRLYETSKHKRMFPQMLGTPFQ